jgi:hypothetical protein
MGTFKTMTKKKGFDPTGNHHERCKERKVYANVLNKLKVYTGEVILRGGTKLKEDALNILNEVFGGSS